MEPAAPIKIETPKPSFEDDKIDFIEELLIKKENNEYKIQFGIKENKNELSIRVISKDIFYYQQNYKQNELQKLEDSQIIYVSGDKQDYIQSSAQVIQMPEEENWFTKIINQIKNIF